MATNGSYEVNPHEYASVIDLSGADRYEYSINKIADWEEVWSVRGVDGWGLVSDDNGRQLVPMWPAREFALACCVGASKSCSPEPIALTHWLERWIPGMQADGRSCAVFSTDHGQRGCCSARKARA